MAAGVTNNAPDWVTRQKQIAAQPPWRIWGGLLHHFAPLASLPGRVTVTGSVDPDLLAGPLIVVANHIGDYDAIVLAPALYKVGIRPRFLATKGLLTAKYIGPLMERAGFIRVDRGSDDARHALIVTDEALRNNGHIVVYPEGRIGLDRDLWPERGRSGVARMALRSRVPVIPVSSWGAHEVLCYADDKRKLSSLARAIWRQPAMKVHIGAPVPLDDLAADRVGDAHRARTRIIAAITMQLQELRQLEPGQPRQLDLTRPCPPGSIAAFPGGRVPDDLRALISSGSQTPRLPSAHTRGYGGDDR